MASFSMSATASKLPRSLFRICTIAALPCLLGFLYLTSIVTILLILAFAPPIFDLYSQFLIPDPFLSDARAVVCWIWTGNSNLHAMLGFGYLSEKELNHFKDVRILIQSLKPMFVILPSVTIFASRIGHIILRSNAIIMRSLASAGLTILALGLLILFTWDSLFNTIHEYLFPVGSWQFLQGSYSLHLFPPDFWRSMAWALVGGTTLVLAVALTIALYRSGTSRFTIRRDHLNTTL